MILTSSLILFASSSVLHRLLRTSPWVRLLCHACWNILSYGLSASWAQRPRHLNVDMNERGNLGEAMPDRSSISSWDMKWALPVRELRGRLSPATAAPNPGPQASVSAVLFSRLSAPSLLDPHRACLPQTAMRSPLRLSLYLCVRAPRLVRNCSCIILRSSRATS